MRRNASGEVLRIGILGEGVAALACAHYLLRAGLHPTVVSPPGGWLAERFPAGPQRLDHFHVPLRRSDTALCGLLADLELLHRVVWRDVDLGLYASEARCWIRSQTDLLRIEPLSVASRLRAIFESMSFPWSARGRADAGATWIGCSHTDILHGWQHRALRRNGCRLCAPPSGAFPRRGLPLGERSRQTYGYLQGGFRTLTDRLMESIVERGGEILRGRRLMAIEADAQGGLVEWDTESRRFDGLVSTLPLASLTKLARGPLVRTLPFPEGSSRGELSVVVLSRRPLELPYLTLPFGGQSPFDRVYHASALLPEEERGELHPVYLMLDSETHAKSYQSSDETLRRTALDFLRELGTGLEPRDVVDVRVFRTAESDLTWAREQLDRPPTRRTGDTLLFLCTAARPFQRSRSADTGVMLARETVSQLTYQI